MANSRLLWGVGAACLALAFAVLCMAMPASPSSPDTVATSPLRATLHDESNPVDAQGRYPWRTLWQLEWPAVPDATHYVIDYKTAEGVSRKASTVDASVFRIEVAKGESQRPGERATREIQLQTIQSLLAVRVTPRLTDGSMGVASAWVEVGRVVP